MSRLVQQIEAMISHRQGRYDTYWQELAEYILPKSAEITADVYGGQSKTNKIFDSTAVNANELFASNLHGMLINYASDWFILESDIDELNNMTEVRGWFDDVTRVCHELLHEPSTGFTSALDELLLELGAFGTSCMAVKYSTESIIRYDTWRVGTYAIAESSEGNVNKLAAKYKMTASQIMEKFSESGDNVPSEIAKAAIDTPDMEFDIYYYIQPRANYKEGAAPTKLKKFAEYYICAKSKEIIREGGYDRFPFKVVRWRKDAGEVYGYSPGMTARADIKTLNEAMKMYIKAAELGLIPPLDVPHDSYYGKIKIAPGAINYRKAMTQEGIKPIYTIDGTPITKELIERLQFSIKQAFYNDILSLRENAAMTATEINQRATENMRFIMPMVGRLLTEGISEIITDTYFIAANNGLITTPMPDALKRSGFKIRYKSQLGIAQSNVETEKILSTIRIIADMAQLDPAVLDPFDLKQAAMRISNNLGYPVEALRDEKKQKELDDNRKQMAEQQNKMNAAMAQAEVVNKTAGVMNKGA